MMFSIDRRTQRNLFVLSSQPELMNLKRDHLFHKRLGRGRLVKALLLGALVLVTGGCSIKLAYNNADRLVRWGVSDYVDLDRQQKAALTEGINRIHRWHRYNHLPLYADYMTELAVVLSDGVTPQDLEAINEQLFTWADEVEAQATPFVIEMMVSLSDAQISALPEKLEDSNVEIAEPETDVSLEDAQALWVEEFTDTLKRFTGRLNRSQREYITRRSSGYRPERVLWADYRRRFQKDLMTILETRTDREKFASAYRDLIERRETYYGPELTEVFEHNQQLNREVAAYVLSNLTDAQGEQFKERLLELGEDFLELSQQEV